MEVEFCISVLFSGFCEERWSGQ